MIANILPVLGALSKMMATVATQPLIIAKVGLQSRPPPQRNGKPFTSFLEVMQFVIERDGSRQYCRKYDLLRFASVWDLFGNIESYRHDMEKIHCVRSSEYILYCG